jgi:hypothetical protein
MHSGLLMAVRRYLLHARPWQQVLVCVALFAIGVALMTVGLFGGAAMIVVSLLFGWQIVSARRALREVPGEEYVQQSAPS